MRWMALFLATGCATRVPIDVMEPAEYTVPASVARLALVDRAPSDYTFKTLYSLRESLADGPRFELVSNEAAQAAFTKASTTVGQPISKEAAEAICKQTAATGIVSLESLRADSQWSWSEREEERVEDQRILKTDGSQENVQVVKNVTVQLATLKMDVVSNWALMDCEGNVLDEHTVALDAFRNGEGDSKSDARLDAGNVNGLRSALLGNVGILYMQRISPWGSQVSRRMFSGGNSHIRAGRRAAVEGDWESAYRRWKTAAKKGNSDSPRAWLNLAVHHEQKGNLKVALKYAKRAAHKLNKRWIHAYVTDLETSIEKKIQLGKQLGPETDDE